MRAFVAADSYSKCTIGLRRSQRASYPHIHSRAQSHAQGGSGCGDVGNSPGPGWVRQEYMGIAGAPFGMVFLTKP
jgi:hypothetical protein